jgi:2-polyprenyl-6-methoxyphenol hydroxylase-like FAD-dependent oxidoreductase
MQPSSSESLYDVVIMGGGVAGQFQARHLLLKVPGIRIAMVEPKDEEEILHIDKIGESTVEIAATFAARDLGLVDYLIENQLPKCGLAFHWPKDPNKTDSILDYYSSWPTRNPTLASYQLHRGKLESAVMKMNKSMGMDFFHGRVVDFDLSRKGEPKSCTFQLAGSKEKQTIRGRFLIDAAGRAFLTGKRTGNLKFGPENLYGLNNGTSWVRVSGVDRKQFVDGMFGNRACTF